jgi:predicted lipid-binding transport protein (Tim44 family)
MQGMLHYRSKVAAAQEDLQRVLMLAGAAAMLALGMMAAAQAQTSQTPPNLAPAQQPGSAEPEVVGRLRTVEQALNQTRSEVSGSQQPNFPQASSTVEAGLRTIRELPQQAQGQQDWREARQKLEQVQQFLRGERPDQQQVASALGDAAKAVGTLATSMSAGGEASGQARSGSGAAR